MKKALLNWLFTKLFGEIDVEAEIYTTRTSILIANLVVTTRRGKFTFPFLEKCLPIPERGTGFIIEGELFDDESEDTRPG